MRWMSWMGRKGRWKGMGRKGWRRRGVGGEEVGVQAGGQAGRGQVSLQVDPFQDPTLTLHPTLTLNLHPILTLDLHPTLTLNLHPTLTLDLHPIQSRMTLQRQDRNLAPLRLPLLTLIPPLIPIPLPTLPRIRKRRMMMITSPILVVTHPLFLRARHLTSTTKRLSNNSYQRALHHLRMLTKHLAWR